MRQIARFNFLQTTLCLRSPPKKNPSPLPPILLLQFRRLFQKIRQPLEPVAQNKKKSKRNCVILSLFLPFRILVMGSRE
ncbi:hypothetical protein FD724_39070 (plasmid) [Nostoc sp. C057]|nr:hypothetical protein [Nostoc sp. C057]QLE53841.1 hypothetical protein FD724_39070 [Nostoc sp. C057]